MRTDGGWASPRPIERRAVSFDPATGLLVVGHRRAKVTCRPGDNECVLRTYLALVAEQRDVPVDRSVVLRQDDVAVLAELLDLDDADLEARLVRLLRLSEREAADLRHQLLRHKVAAATIGVGMLAAVPVAASAATSDPAPPSSTTSSTTSTTIAVEPTTATTVAPTTTTVTVVVPATDAPATAADPEPAPEADPAPPTTAPPTEIGDAIRYERDPDYTPPPGVEIGDALVIERGTPPPAEG
jgi:hypothetical protein